MNDHEIDQVLRRAQPESATRVPAVASRLRKADQELLEDIMNRFTPDLVPEPLPVEPAEPTTLVPRLRIADWSSGRRWLVGAVAAAVVAVAILVPTTIFGDQGRNPEVPVPPVASTTMPDTTPTTPDTTPTPDTTSSAPPDTTSTTEAALLNPYLLLKSPGWSVSYVGEEYRSDGVDGSLNFVRKQSGLSISWVSAGNYREYYDNAREQGGEPDSIQFLGQEAALWDLGTSEFTVLARVGPALISVSGTQMEDRQTFEQYLGSLSRVKPQKWFDAMPDWAVVPAKSAAAGEQIVRDVTLPDGFDTALLTSNLTRTRVAFGELVMRRVTCVWLDDYEKAHDAENDAGMTKVSEALSTIRDSAFIQSVAEEASLPLVWDEYVKDTSAGKDVTGTLHAEGCAVRVS